MTLITPSIVQVTINPNLKFASGSIVGATNIGDGEGTLFTSVSQSLLPFKTIKAGTGIIITNNSNDVTITSSSSFPYTPESILNKSTDTNLGTSDIFYPSQNAVKVYVNNAILASGSTNTFQNIGTGEGEVYESKSGSVVSLRTIKAGTNIEVINTVDAITINSSGTVPDTRTINSYPLTSNIVLSKSDIGLSLVDNTADGDKPLSSASIIALSSKVNSNVAITPGTFTKVTVDSKGLVTSGTGALTSDINDSLDKRYVTDTQLIVIENTSSTNTGDETQSTIKQKLGSASITQDGYLSQTDFNIFNNKQDALAYTPENILNKSTDVNLGTSNILYPTQNAVKTYVDINNISASGSSLGSGSYSVYSHTSGSVLYFKTLEVGNNINITDTGSTLIISSSGSPALTANKTVNFDNSMTTTVMQALIDEQPKNLNNYTLTFQFADGTYQFGASNLKILGFQNGAVFLYGNPGENTAARHINQAVIIDHTSTTKNFPLEIRYCQAKVNSLNLRINLTSATYDSYAILVYNCTNVAVSGCYLNLDAITDGKGVYVQGANVLVQFSYFTKGNVGIMAYDRGYVYSNENAEITTSPAYGLNSTSSIMFKSGVQPSGSTANTIAASGGQIF